MTRIIQEDRPETLERIRELEQRLDARNAELLAVIRLLPGLKANEAGEFVAACVRADKAEFALSASQERATGAEERVRMLESGLRKCDDYAIALQRIIEALEGGTPFTPDAKPQAGWHLAMAERVRARERRMREALRDAFEWLPLKTDLEDPDDTRDFAEFLKNARAALAPVTETAPRASEPEKFAWQTEKCPHCEEWIRPISDRFARCGGCGDASFPLTDDFAAPAETSTRAEEGRYCRSEGPDGLVCVSYTHPPDTDCIAKGVTWRRPTPTETAGEPKAGSRVVAHFIRPEKKEGES